MATENKKNKTENKTVDSKTEQQELKALLQRTQANLENYRKQTEKRIEEMEQMAAKNIILQVLPVIDNFELALKNADTNNNPKDFLMGVELIYAQLNSMLENNGIKPIEATGIFDPFYHEALMKIESDLPENTIMEEFQRGFTLNDKVLRHTKVKVSAGKKDLLKEKSENKKLETKKEN